MTGEAGTDAPSVWPSSMDGQHDVRVTCTEHTRLGLLTIADTRDGRVLLEETVPLSFGVLFGPHILDVHACQRHTRGVPP